MKSSLQTGQRLLAGLSSFGTVGISSSAFSFSLASSRRSATLSSISWEIIQSDWPRYQRLDWALLKKIKTYYNYFFRETELLFFKAYFLPFMKYLFVFIHTKMPIFMLLISNCFIGRISDSTIGALHRIWIKNLFYYSMLTSEKREEKNCENCTSSNKIFARFSISRKK